MWKTQWIKEPKAGDGILPVQKELIDGIGFTTLPGDILLTVDQVDDIHIYTGWWFGTFFYFPQ